MWAVLFSTTIVIPVVRYSTKKNSHVHSWRKGALNRNSSKSTAAMQILFLPTCHAKGAF